MRSRNIVESFNYAIEGIIYAVKTQRNIKVHLIMAMLAMILAVVLNVTRVELLILMLTIGLVISTELINTAIEEVVNLAHEGIHPLARVAKNVAAGAVLFSSVMAVGVGYIILFQRLIRFDLRQLMRGIAVENLGLLAMLVVLGSIILTKSATGSSDYLKGGMPSGHTALAFSLAVAIMYSGSTFAACLGFALAFLVAHTRVQSRIHSLREVIVGGLLGFLITMILFQLSA